jgi:hypothetical protein
MMCQWLGVAQDRREEIVRKGILLGEVPIDRSRGPIVVPERIATGRLGLIESIHGSVVPRFVGRNVGVREGSRERPVLSGEVPGGDTGAQRGRNVFRNTGPARNPRGNVRTELTLRETIRAKQIVVRVILEHHVDDVIDMFHESELVRVQSIGGGARGRRGRHFVVGRGAGKQTDHGDDHGRHSHAHRGPRRPIGVLTFGVDGRRGTAPPRSAPPPRDAVSDRRAPSPARSTRGDAGRAAPDRCHRGTPSNHICRCIC